MPYTGAGASGINLETVTLEDLQYQYHAISGKIGRYVTRSGGIEEKEFRRILEYIVLRDYDGWLVDSLEEYYQYDTSGCFAKDARWHALDAYLSGLQDNERWVGYLSFNRKYRPGLIKGRTFPIVEADCCQKPGPITQLQFDEGRTTCPACGRFTGVKLVGRGAIDTEKMEEI